jgi:thiopurine S-methyltransferase
MDHEFWLERWRTNQIGFHQTAFNARLMQHWPALGLATDARVFVPLCGKSRDMLWLAGTGHAVTGVELSSTAVEAFFAEAGAPRSRRQAGPFVFYDGGRIGVYCGDFFALTEREVAGTAGVFDRGALIALPPAMRRRYAEHLLNILPVGAQSLLLTIEYDQDRASGPPFSVQPEEVADLFGARCSVELLDRSPAQEMPPRFQAQGIREAGESTYRIIKER